MTAKLFEQAIGIEAPWYVRDVSFDMAGNKVTIFVDFTVGSRFPHPQFEGLYPVYDTTTQRYRHLNIFDHKCILEVQVPRVQLPDDSVRMIEPSWPASRSGSKLWCDALSADPFPVCASLVNERRHKIGNDLWSYSRFGAC